MRTGEHYDPRRTQGPTADKATTRIKFEIAAGDIWRIEEMEKCNAYFHDPAMDHQPE